MSINGLAVGVAALLAVTPIAASARATDFVLVNATGAAMQAVSIRRFGTGPWQTLAVAPGSGVRRGVRFNNEDCAFDIRATLWRETIVWSGVNLCDANAVILQRDASGAAWVDYE